MKLLRVGQKGKEKPAALDKDGKIRDISSHVEDLNPHHLNFETISKSEFSNLQKKHISHVNSSMNIASQISQINSLFDEIKKKL